MAENVHLWEIVMDCAEPSTLATFYSQLLGCGMGRRSDENWYWIEPPLRGGVGADSAGVRIAFQRVPEPKLGKVRLHLDLGSDDIPATVERAIELGATQIHDPVTDDSGTYVVLTDPEGHELCIVTASTATESQS